MSLYLVSDFGYEMRDVVGTPEDIFYSFIGVPNLLTGQDLEKLLSEDVFGLDAKEIIDLLLWYGFLGIVGPSTEPIFIYDRAYDFRRLEAERADTKDKALYAVNPPFSGGWVEGSLNAKESTPIRSVRGDLQTASPRGPPTAIFKKPYYLIRFNHHFRRNG